jgi:hypothetical protein
MKVGWNRSVTDERGSALTMMTFSVAAMIALSAALLITAAGDSREERGAREGMHARYVAQAGLSQAMYQLSRGQSGQVGTATAPQSFGRSRFWVTATNLATDLIQLRSTGVDDRRGACSELVVRSVPNTIYRFGAFGRENLHLDSNTRVDSYNSNNGTYASQATNLSGSNQYANPNGDVGSNGDVELDQNANVWGDSFAGPGHSTTILGNASVSGSITPAPDPMELPVINVPSYANYGALTVNSNSMTLPPGNRAYTTLRINTSKTLNVTGPASIVINSLELRSGAQLIVDATGGPVELFVIDNFIMNSNAAIYSTSLRPNDVKLNLLSDNVINPDVTVQLDVIDFDSNSNIHGIVYAPNAEVIIDSNFELFGSLVARRVDLDSNVRIHFDEALLTATSTGVPRFETVCWRDVPYE